MISVPGWHGTSRPAALAGRDVSGSVTGEAVRLNVAGAQRPAVGVDDLAVLVRHLDRERIGAATRLAIVVDLHGERVAIRVGTGEHADVRRLVELARRELRDGVS